MINLNDLVTFIGTPTLITWSYGDCANPSPTPSAGQPTITDTGLGTIDPTGAPAGSYTYNVTYTDSAGTSGTGCDDYCIDITVTIADSSNPEWKETVDGYYIIPSGTFVNEEYYHICCFGGTYATEDGNLTFEWDIVPAANFDGDSSADVSVDGGVVIGPIAGTFLSGATGGSITLTQGNIVSIITTGTNVGVDIGEATMTVLLSYDTAFDDDTDPTNDATCDGSDVINLLIGPCINEDNEVFDCTLIGDATAFNLYDWILNAGTGNTAPGTLTGGVGNQAANPQGGIHYWVLSGVNTELYNAITNEPGVVDKAGGDITIYSTPTTSTILNLDLTALTAGPHAFSLQHFVEFNETNYVCSGTIQSFNIDTTNCCDVQTSSADPIILCNT